MLIPHKRAELIRQASNILFYNIENPKNHRIKVFWKLLRPLLSWLKEELINNFSLLSNEAESEIYLYCAYLFDHFNKDKSSIIPYLARFIHLYKGRLYKKLSRQKGTETPVGLIRYKKQPICIPDEIYLTTPNILFETRYLGKVFTTSQKYIINTILVSDANITQEKLAQKCCISTITLRKHISELAILLEGK